MSENKTEAKSELLATIRTVGIALAIAFLIRIIIFEPFEIDGPSMEPSLLHGERVIVLKYEYGLFLPFMDEAIFTWGTPDLGDIVIVKSPLDGVDIIKRVVGVPGDVVEMRGGIVYRNGQAVPHEPVRDCISDERANFHSRECTVYREEISDYSYLVSHDPNWLSGGVGSARVDMPPIRIPEDHVVVFGDHRDQSNDSRNPRIRAVPTSRLRGRAAWVLTSKGESWRWDRMFSGIR